MRHGVSRDWNEISRVPARQSAAPHQGARLHRDEGRLHPANGAAAISQVRSMRQLVVAAQSASFGRPPFCFSSCCSTCEESVALFDCSAMQTDNQVPKVADGLRAERHESRRRRRVLLRRSAMAFFGLCLTRGNDDPYTGLFWMELGAYAGTLLLLMVKIARKHSLLHARKTRPHDLSSLCFSCCRTDFWRLV